MVLRTTNLDWRSLPLGEQLKKLTGLPVYLGNDADCAALGEVHAGAARDYDSAVDHAGHRCGRRHRGP